MVVSRDGSAYARKQQNQGLNAAAETQTHVIDSTNIWWRSGGDIETLNIEVCPPRHTGVADGRIKFSVAQRVLPALGKVIMQVFDQPVHDSSRQLVGNYGRNCQHEDR